MDDDDVVILKSSGEDVFCNGPSSAGPEVHACLSTLYIECLGLTLKLILLRSLANVEEKKQAGLKVTEQGNDSEINSFKQGWSDTDGNSDELSEDNMEESSAHVLMPWVFNYASCDDDTRSTQFQFIISQASSDSVIDLFLERFQCIAECFGEDRWSCFRPS